MKMISIQTDAVGAMPSSSACVAAPADWRMRSQAAVAQWLSAPAMPRHVAKIKLRKPAVQSVWITLPHEPALEKAFIAGLVGAAAIGIGYGFLCLLNLVENWAAVNSVVGRMIS